MDSSPSIILLAAIFVATAAAVPVTLWAVTPIWDGIVARHIKDLTPQFNAINMDTSQLPGYLRLWGVAMAAAFVILWQFLGMLPVALAVVGIIYTLPRYLMEGAITGRKIRLRDQLVGAGVALANSCRAGLSLPQAFAEVSREIPDPLAAEFKRISRDYSAGRPFAESLTDVKVRMDLDSFTLFASAILVCLQAGGNMTVALERISASLQENQRLERKLEADTAAGKSVVMILTAFPWVFLAGFYLFEPEGTTLMFTTIPGQIVVVAIGALVYVSYRWAMKILNVNI